MKNARTITGLKYFSYLFFALSVLCLIGGIAGTFAIDIPEANYDNISKAAQNLGKFAVIAVGVFYALTFAFFGLTSRAVAMLMAGQNDAAGR